MALLGSHCRGTSLPSLFLNLHISHSVWECKACGQLEPGDTCPPTALGSLGHGVSGERKGSGRDGFQSLRQELCPEGNSLDSVSRAQDLLSRARS